MGASRNVQIVPPKVRAPTLDDFRVMQYSNFGGRGQNPVYLVSAPSLLPPTSDMKPVWLSNAPHTLGLFATIATPARSEPSNELMPSHWITSSAVANSVSEMVRPSALAALWLITRLNFVGC